MTDRNGVEVKSGDVVLAAGNIYRAEKSLSGEMAFRRNNQYGDAVYLNVWTGTDEEILSRQ